ncbi:MAG: enoyl-CoA hydratase/isomerase family protein [Sphingomonadales bacterium]|jgi:enoyl-CoA hydratase|nr:enoyl-CoA hydratase/isomerase family protein [Sphingomonadales bacterium]MBK9003047.1 enoyl-CoA hydratase/isomerase family protein [Sphingomonadales bacterium]MBK9268295.1 enoyl-CoA hydratase/isomerase family protein [Sphingomonadales bacterium]MBP6435040.1 enoyl-CoA hydratase/isomerase family protein [Sphingorhabdus sp.]
MTDLVTREDRDGIAILSLNRPDKRNALNIALWLELEAHIASVRDAGEAIGAVVLRANGPTFCAGNDLKERGVDLPRPNFQASIVTALATLPQPVIIAVQGGCYTGGLELALAGDIILAAENAVFADTHGKFALVPIWGMSQRLPRRIGQWKAREMSFTGLPVSGAEAARIGLANHVIADAELDTKALELANAIAAQSRHSVFAYKRLYQEQADLPLNAGLAYEVFNSAGVGPDFVERVSGQFGK